MVATETSTWDDNGNMTTGIGVSITRNADGRIQSATAGSNSIDCVYDPEGRMVRKVTTIGQSSSTEKYILDVVGDYPVVLMVKDPNTPSNNKAYVHANCETLTERVFIYKYFYLHDRLGSVRQLVNTSGNVVNSYTYDPWGNAFPSETSETVDNDIEFANYQWDDTVGMYYLNARWYDPVILRFTGRDPVRGKLQKPLSLHVYLYCVNDPVNGIDPSGKFIGSLIAGAQSMALRGKEAAFGSWAKLRALDSLQKSIVGMNAVYGGLMNVYAGPSEVSDAKLFAIGAFSGALEASLAMGSITGVTVASGTGAAIESALNQCAADDPFFSWKTLGTVAANTAFSTGLTGMGEWLEEGGLSQLEKIMLLLDVRLGRETGNRLAEFFSE